MVLEGEAILYYLFPFHVGLFLEMPKLCISRSDQYFVEDDFFFYTWKRDISATLRVLDLSFVFSHLPFSFVCSFCLEFTISNLVDPVVKYM